MAMTKPEQILWEKISLSTRHTISRWSVGMPTMRLREIVESLGFKLLVVMENGAPMVETEETNIPNPDRMHVRSSPDGQVLEVKGWG